MRVKAKVDHVNDYSTTGRPGVALGDDRFKAKGKEYDIPDEDDAKRLVEAGTVEAVSKK
jgi:hypothetical protein